MKTILIATSKFGKPVSDYYKALGNQFKNDRYKVIYIFDDQIKDLPKNSINTLYYTWPSKRPTRIKDFIFLAKIIKKEKPILCISNFGSTNIVSIISYIFRVKNRINYIHSTTKQIKVDSQKTILMNKFLRVRKKLIFRLNTHFFTNSDGTKKDTIENYNISEKKISVFPLLIKPVETDYISRDEREDSIVIVGRLSPSKGHKDLLHQFFNCVSDFPNLKLKIIGDGYLKDDLKNLALKLNISERVIFTGGIPNRDINSVFSTSLVSISSSKYEAYGLVNIEALREGTPLICTKTAGSFDILIENKNGLFFNMEKKYSLNTALKRILFNWDEFSKNSKRIFNDNYSLSNIKKHYKRRQL